MATREFTVYGKPERWALNALQTRAPWMWRNVIASWPLWEGSGGKVNNVHGHVRGSAGHSVNSMSLYMGSTSEMSWLGARDGVGVLFSHTNDDTAGIQSFGGSGGNLKIVSASLNHTYEIVFAIDEANAALNGVQCLFTNGGGVNGNVGGNQLHVHSSNSANYGLGYQQGSGGGSAGTHRSSCDYSTATAFSGDYGEVYHAILSFSGVGSGARCRLFINGRDFGNLARTSGSGSSMGYSATSRIAIGGAPNINNAGLRKGRIYAVNMLQGQVQASEALARSQRFWEMFQPERTKFVIAAGGGSSSTIWGQRVNSRIIAPVRQLILPTGR